MVWIYNLFTLFASPLWVPWMWWRARQRKEAPNWKERCGNYSHIKIERNKPAVWIHAVSVGEVMATLPILREVRRLMPGHHIVLSVTTSSGHATAREHASELFDDLVYFPIDLLRFQMSALMRIRPEVVAIMETELWMNFVFSAKELGIATLLINGRISDRSFPRSQKVRFFYRALLANVDRCLMQTQRDADRILAIGARSAEVFGNSKFDQAVEGLQEDLLSWRQELGIAPDLPVVVIGSTRSEVEEEIVASALGKIGREIGLIWAPRHLERADAVAEHIAETFGQCARRSRSERGNHVLLDTYGELAKVYCVADIVIIGGGFDQLGGQNLIQPLAHGKPVLHGPYMHNFQDVTTESLRVGSSRVCSNAAELAEALIQLLDHPEIAANMGAEGRAFVAANAGASERYAIAIQEAGSKMTKLAP
ncbi:MAG: 3-deoxy-D-manno-octulosonic acid transferase [Fimbriimonadaceae bacterium]